MKTSSNQKNKIFIPLEIFLIVLLMFGVIGLTLINFYKTSETSVPSNFNNMKLKISQVSGKIHIDNNWTAAKSAGICTGDGNYSNPYVIEDLVIDGGGTGSCIFIENSDEVFKIENCTLLNSGGSQGDAAIHLLEVENGRIINNDLTLSNNVGLLLEFCYDTMIFGNNISDNYFGMFLVRSDNNNVSENTVNDNIEGIWVWYSGNNIISGNSVCSNIDKGIDFFEANSNVISGNIINYNDYGLRFFTCDNNIISRNNLTGNENCIHEVDCVGNIFENNNCIKGEDPKDLIAPNITIKSPSPNQLCGIAAPSFSLTIEEPNLQEKRYSLNGRPNITFTTEAQFSQSEWDNIASGTVVITFYAIDKAGNVNSSQVIVRKDANIPYITIISPIQDEIFGRTSPEFNISIIEENLVSTWYTLEGLTGNFSFTSLTGSINQDAWDDAPEGEITITFHALDGTGNLGTENVMVTKNIPSVPVISGYNLTLLIGAISIISAVLIKNQKHK